MTKRRAESIERRAESSKELIADPFDPFNIAQGFQRAQDR
jgi:hypothetical protein